MPEPVLTQGLIFDIQRFCTLDGPGIRTVVFLKGCPLTCPWCHNPESRPGGKQVLFSSALCLRCGACMAVCGRGAHTVDGAGHFYDRGVCTTCLRCVDECPTGALEASGRAVTTAEVIAEAVKDRVFFEETGGGVTVSGGEPLVQFDFTRGILSACRESGLHTCVETSGAVRGERLPELVELVDLWLWDIKDTDPVRHQRNTGAALETILRNLRLIDSLGGCTVLRCVLLAGVNLDGPHLDGIGSLATSLQHCAGVEILPFHPLGASKYERMGCAMPAHDARTPSPGECEAARGYLRAEWGVGAEVVS